MGPTFVSRGQARSTRSSSIHEVMDDGPGAVVRFLLPLIPSATTSDDTRYVFLLQMAVATHDMNLVTLLLGRGLDVNARGCYYGTALQCAARYGHIDLVQLLLRSGADANILAGEHGTALRAAAAGGHEGVMDVLLEHGADVNLRAIKSDN